MGTAHRMAKYWSFVTLGGYLLDPASGAAHGVLAQVFDDAPAPSSALARAHAHNDYAHSRPLYDALRHGFTSIEADVWLWDGELLVGHDLAALRPGRTLSALYLDPLRERVLAHDGLVYEDYPHSVQLLIDVKSEAEPTYRALRGLLARYQELLTVFSEAGVREGAVTVVISGNRARAEMEREPLRFAAYDGRKSDLGSQASPAFMPLISDDWNRLFRWQGLGAMPRAERDELRAFVEAAHARGQRVRLWATQEEPHRREAVWQELLDAGVDYINSDDLAGLASWLNRYDAWPSTPEVDWFDAVRASRFKRHGLSVGMLF